MNRIQVTRVGQRSSGVRGNLSRAALGTALLAQVTGCDAAPAANGPSPTETSRQAVHGPVPSLHARVVEAPAGDHALCDARVRGVLPASGGYSATLTLAIPGEAPIEYTGTVSAALPTYDAGPFSLELVESPPGSGELLVHATIRQPFVSASTDDHDCAAVVLADSDGDLSFDTPLMTGSASASLTNVAGQVQDANSVRVAGEHLVCRWRLHVGPRSDLVGPFAITAATTTDQGPDTTALSIARGAPMEGPIVTANGGTLLAEWVTPPAALEGPSLEVRFDHFPMPSGTGAVCDFSVEDVATATVLATSQTGATVCAPSPELCGDQTDDNCDGFADEILEIGSSQPIGTYSTTGGSVLPFDATTAWVDSRGLGAVVWVSQSNATSFGLRFSLFDALGSSVVGDQVVLNAPTRPRNLRVGWDGSAWAIFYSSAASSALRVTRVNDSGMVVTPDQSVLRPLGPINVSVVNLAQGESSLVVVTDRSVTFQIVAFKYQNGAVSNEYALFGGFTSAPARPAIAYLGSGRYAAFVGSPLSSLFVQRFDADTGPDSPSYSFAPDVDLEIPWEAAYDSGTGNIAFLYEDAVGAPTTQRIHQVVLPASDGGPVTPPLDVDSAGAGIRAFLGAAADGSFAAVTSAASTPTRTRASDGVPYSVPLPPTVAPPLDLTGLAGSPSRFVVLTTSVGSGILYLQVYSC